jgi:ubiquinone/menaquinone biosynthesis C-methylase UbiE
MRREHGNQKGAEGFIFNQFGHFLIPPPLIITTIISPQHRRHYMHNNEQIEYWNGDAGKRWAQEDDVMARLLQPICEALLDHADIAHCRNALDVGCGGGSQSLLLAQRLGLGAMLLGVDISAPMLEVAQSKCALVGETTASMQFLQADAATPAFQPGSFDLLFSRFGVMFFDEPTAAFSNMRLAMTDNAQVAFCCWQSLRDNDWTLLPLQAALRHVEMPEAPSANAPGPFAFADPEYLRRIMAAAGFGDIDIHSHNTNISIGQGPDLSSCVHELARIGPVSRLLVGADDTLLKKVFGAMKEVLAPYYNGSSLVLPAAIWFVTARAR